MRKEIKLLQVIIRLDLLFFVCAKFYGSLSVGSLVSLALLEANLEYASLNIFLESRFQLPEKYAT